MSVTSATVPAVAYRLQLNNVSELRLFFALAVLVSHTIQLGRFSEYNIWRYFLSSEIAVQGFFILSGYLVFGSFARHSRVSTFYLRRILRIYPAYVVAVLLFLVLGLCQARWLGAKIEWDQVGSYLLANLVLLNFLQPGVEGVFAFWQPSEINGALWTIKLEAMFYAMVPLLYAAGRCWSFRAVAAVLIVVGLGWRPFLAALQVHAGLTLHPSLAHQLPGQLHFFGLGLLLFDVSRDPSSQNANALVALSAILLALVAAPWGQAVQMCGLMAAIYLIVQLPEVRHPFQRIDLSYGVYLAHFPIILLLANAGAASWGAGAFLLAVLVLAGTYASLSWFWVESPALGLSRRLWP